MLKPMKVMPNNLLRQIPRVDAILESAGWKAGSGTAVAPDNAQGRFYRAMLEAFAARGQARIYRYRFGDHQVTLKRVTDNEISVSIDR